MYQIREMWVIALQTVNSTPRLNVQSQVVNTLIIIEQPNQGIQVTSLVEPITPVVAILSKLGCLLRSMVPLPLPGLATNFNNFNIWLFHWQF